MITLHSSLNRPSSGGLRGRHGRGGEHTLDSGHSQSGVRVMQEFDVVVLGTGAAGLTAAIRAHAVELVQKAGRGDSVQDTWGAHAAEQSRVHWNQ